MSLPIIRYPYDPTGVNPDNAVVGEVHSLNTHVRIRAAAPQFGPFFTENLVVYDHTTNRLLVRGDEYDCVQLLQEATLNVGKEVAELILIKDETVSNDIRINYQVLGGLYQNNVQGIVNLYEAFLMDERPVDWTNVLNKPYFYPPTLHNHLLKDLYGFEPIVAALERVRNAIIVSDIPAYEALVDFVNSKVVPVSEEQINNGDPVTNVVTFERLLYALDKFNFNGITLNPNRLQYIRPGSVINFQLSSTNLPDNSTLYWTIDHIDTDDSDFNSLSGVVNINANRGQFQISISPNANRYTAKTFKVALRRSGVDGYVIKTSSLMTLGRDVGTSIIHSFNACCLYSPFVNINPFTYHVIQEKL